jgi:Sulfotransferase domain
MIAELMTGMDPDFHEAHRAVPEVADAFRVPVVPGRDGRTVRSHEPWRSKYARTVYFVRDPRDVAVSYYHYRKWLREYSGSLGEFVRLFARGLVDTYGRWDDHVASWSARAPVEVFVLHFEHLIADTQTCLSDAAMFLGLPNDRAAIDSAIEHNAAAFMRGKERAAHAGFSDQTDPRRSFVRSARSGVWQGELAANDIRVIESAFGGAMTRMGYDLSSSGSRARGPSDRQVLPDNQRLP